MKRKKESINHIKRVLGKRKFVVLFSKSQFLFRMRNQTAQCSLFWVQLSILMFKRISYMIIGLSNRIRSTKTKTKNWQQKKTIQANQSQIKLFSLSPFSFHSAFSFFYWKKKHTKPFITSIWWKLIEKSVSEMAITQRYTTCKSITTATYFWWI